MLIQDWILSAAPLLMFLNIEINVDLLWIVFDGAARLALLDALVVPPLLASASVR